MKRSIHTLLFTALSILQGIIANAQPFDNLPKARQDSILIEIAKRTVMEYGPDWYRDKFPPVIRKIDQTGGYRNGQRIDRYWYVVSFPYDRTEEYMYNSKHSVEVAISRATLDPECLFFGNNRMIDLTELPKTRSAEKPVMPYVPMERIYNPPPKVRAIDIDTGRDVTPKDSCIMIVSTHISARNTDHISGLK